MSVVARNLKLRNEVETMSTTTISQQSCTTVFRRTAAEILAEKLARRLLAWSTRRQQRAAQPSHEHMALIRANVRHEVAGGSSFGR
jgi:hypothetical protein